jgi:hypothetical protein
VGYLDLSASLIVTPSAASDANAHKPFHTFG